MVGHSTDASLPLDLTLIAQVAGMWQPSSDFKSTLVPHPLLLHLHSEGAATTRLTCWSRLGGTPLPGPMHHCAQATRSASVWTMLREQNLLVFRLC